jgi:hypothetical protein
MRKKTFRVRLFDKAWIRIGVEVKSLDSEPDVGPHCIQCGSQTLVERRRTFFLKQGHSTKFPYAKFPHPVVHTHD